MQFRATDNITGNQATGGSGASGGREARAQRPRAARPKATASPGQTGTTGPMGTGTGGGLYLDPKGTASILDTSLGGNHASTSDDDVSRTPSA